MRETGHLSRLRKGRNAVATSSEPLSFSFSFWHSKQRISSAHGIGSLTLSRLSLPFSSVDEEEMDEEGDDEEGVGDAQRGFRPPHRSSVPLLLLAITSALNPTSDGTFSVRYSRIGKVRISGKISEVSLSTHSAGTTGNNSRPMRADMSQTSYLVGKLL